MSRLAVTGRRALLGALIAAYLYAGLGVTAAAFYELYHLIKIEFVYYFYSAFKAASYYLPRWEWYWLFCVMTGLMISLPWWQFLKARREVKP